MLISILCVSYYVISKINTKHLFWDEQPVSRGVGIDGKILKNINIKTKIKVPDGYKLVNIDVDNEFISFIKNNYIKCEYYDLDYMKWIFTSPCEYKFLYGLRDEKTNELIGTITSRSIKMKLPVSNENNKNNETKLKKVLYVDFLCVKKSHRDKRLAPLLISKMVETYKNINYDTCFFSKDEKPLPFKYISKVNYHLCKGSEIGNKSQNQIRNQNQIEKINESNCNDAHKFFMNNVRKYKIYQSFTFEEFKHYFMNGKIDTYVKFTSSKSESKSISDFISILRYTYENQKYIFIQYLFFENQNENQNLKSLTSISDFNDSNIILSDFQCKTQLKYLNKSKLDYIHPMYYHLYNYEIKKTQNTDFCISMT